MVCPGAIERYLSCGDTMAAWKSIECIIGAADTRTPGTRLVAAIRHREADLVADASADRWSRHLVAEGPPAEFHARRDLDDLVGRVQADLLHGRRIERLQRRRHGQRVAGGEGARLPRGGDPGRRRLEVHRGRVVRIGRGRRPRVTGGESERQEPEPAPGPPPLLNAGRGAAAMDLPSLVWRYFCGNSRRGASSLAPGPCPGRESDDEPRLPYSSCGRHVWTRNAVATAFLDRRNLRRAVVKQHGTSFTSLTEAKDGRSSHRGGNPSILEILAQLTLMFLLPPVATLLSTTRALTEAAAVD